MQTQTERDTLKRVQDDFNSIVLEHFPEFCTYSPAYRYFRLKGSKDQCFWTTEPVKHNGKLRYASGIYRYIKTKKMLKLTQERYHAKRSDAKTRALKLWEQKQEVKSCNNNQNK